MAVADRSLSPAYGSAARPSLFHRLWHQPVGRLLILPALIYAIIVTQAPFLLTLYYSFQRWNLQRPSTRGFAGLDNYKFLLTRDNAFRDALLNTAIFTVSAVLLSLLVGLFYAELVNHRFPGRGVVRTLLITPFLVMPAAASLTWKNMMLNPTYGAVDWLTRTALPGNPSPNWLGVYPKESIILVLVWRWAPFMMLILLAGMQSISEEVREAARVDGATAWQEFRSITLPHLSRFMQLGGLLGTVYIVQDFDPIYLMTKGGPGTATTNLSYLTYRKAVEASNVGQGAALGVIVVILSMIVITLLIRWLDRMMRGT
ncbi:MAG: sugar ABC transporter permease [Chloroflexota bacterium]|nr:sugar ABC transporter permease [Chloroflexota bacterium]MDP9473085.1 sugar ABC transporter permease [Chloroflexota bacterium]